MAVETALTLCSVEQVRKLIRMGTNFDRYDELVTMFVRIASQQVLKYVGKDLQKGKRVEYFSTAREGRSTIIRLSGENVDYNEPIEVDYDYTGYFIGGETALTDDVDYKINPITNELSFLSLFDYAPRAIRVQYTAGYDVSSSELQVPATYGDAAAIQAAWLYSRWQSGSFGKQSEEKENTLRIVWTKSAQAGVCDEVKGMLKGSTRQPYIGKY